MLFFAKPWDKYDKNNVNKSYWKVISFESPSQKVNRKQEEKWRNQEVPQSTGAIMMTPIHIIKKMLLYYVYDDTDRSISEPQGYTRGRHNKEYY